MRKENNMYYAADSKLIVRKKDNFVMGDAICLGSADSIENYEERDFTEEKINAFNKKYGVKLPSDEHKNNQNEKRRKAKTRTVGA